MEEIVKDLRNLTSRNLMNHDFDRKAAQGRQVGMDPEPARQWTLTNSSSRELALWCSIQSELSYKS